MLAHYQAGTGTRGQLSRSAGFVYNGDGVLVARRANGVTVAQYAAGGSFEKDPSTGAYKKYYHLGGKLVAEREVPSGGTSATVGTLHYLHQDHLGSTSLQTTASGQYEGHQFRAPFGQPWASGGTLATDLQYTGQRSYEGGAAPLGSLLDYGARSYSPVLGKFLQADTIVPSAGDPQSLNRYAYTRNNPLRYIDPDGHREATGCDDDPCGSDITPDGGPWDDLKKELDDLGKELQDAGKEIRDAGQLVGDAISLAEAAISSDPQNIMEAAATVVDDTVTVVLDAVQVASDAAQVVQDATGQSSAQPTAVRPPPAAPASNILLESEGPGRGHTIDKHVGKDRAFLVDRLRNESDIPAATSFTDLGTASRVVDTTIAANTSRIQDWLDNTNRPTLRLNFTGDLSDPVGYGILRENYNDGHTMPQWMPHARVVLRRDRTAPSGYIVLTAFPEE